MMMWRFLHKSQLCRPRKNIKAPREEKNCIKKWDGIKIDLKRFTIGLNWRCQRYTDEYDLCFQYIIMHSGKNIKDKIKQERLDKAFHSL